MNLSRTLTTVRNATRVLRRQGLAATIERTSARLVLSIGGRLFGSAQIAKANQYFKHWEKALDYWALDEKRNGVNYENVFGRATCLISLRRSEEVIKLLNRTSAEISVNSELLLKLAEAQFRAGQIDEAQQTYESAANLYPNISDAQRKLLLAHSQMHLIPARLKLTNWVESNLAEIQSLALSLPPTKSNPAKVFVFWAQGFESSPKIVRYCLSRLRQFVSPDTLAVLTSENLAEYLRLPKHFDRIGKLYPAHYSDILRVALLSEYEGLWVDATVLVETELPGEYLEKNIFFTFRYEGARMASWFMAASHNAWTPRILYAALQVYWKQHKLLDNYFLLHDLLEVLYYLDLGVRDEWDAMTAESAVPSAQLGGKLLWQPFDQERLKQALAERPIQKLSYKPGKRDHGAGTLYRRLTDSIG